MDGVAISIIGRPRPLPGHDTPNPTHNTYTLNYEEPEWENPRPGHHQAWERSPSKQGLVTTEGRVKHPPLSSLFSLLLGEGQQAIPVVLVLGAASSDLGGETRRDVVDEGVEVV